MRHERVLFRPVDRNDPLQSPDGAGGNPPPLSCNPLTGLFRLRPKPRLRSKWVRKASRCNPLTGLFRLRRPPNVAGRKAGHASCNPLTGLFRLRHGGKGDGEDDTQGGCNPLTGLFRLRLYPLGAVSATGFLALICNSDSHRSDLCISGKVKFWRSALPYNLHGTLS